MIQAAGQNIQYAQTKANFLEVLHGASRQDQELGKSGAYAATPVLQNLLIKTPTAQALNMSVPKPVNAVNQKADTIKVTAPELLVANCNHIQEKRSNANISEVLRGAGKYIKENSGTILQAGDATVTAGAFLTIPILNIYGFAAMGPLAGSSAAIWQSSLGLVPAGSAFAWCQSATMGGAAVSHIIAA
jgi:hypothetical protein